MWPVLILVLALIALSFTGPPPSDEYWYFENAVDLSKGTFQITGHHFDNRFGLLIPLAICTIIFGTAPWVSILPSLLAYAALLWTTHYYLKRDGAVVRQWGLFLVALNPVVIQQASQVSPDLILTVCCWLAFVIYDLHGRQGRWFWAAWFAFIVMWAWATKLTAVFVFGALFTLLVLDMRRAEKYKFWTRSGILFGVLFLLYHLIYLYYTGDALFRYSGVGLSYMDDTGNPFSYVGKPLEVKLTRAFIQSPAFFLYSFSYAGVTIFAILLLLSRKNGKLQAPIIFWISLLMLLTLGSVSYKEYVPITLADRMLLPLIPVASILTVRYTSMVRHPTVAIRATLVVLLILSCIGVVFIFDRKPEIVFTVFLLVATIFFTFLRTWSLHYLNSIVLALFILCGFFTAYEQQSASTFFAERHHLRSLPDNSPTLLIADHGLRRFHRAHFNFKQPSNLRWTTLDSLSSEMIEDEDQIILIMNLKREQYHLPKYGDSYAKKIVKEMKDERKDKLLFQHLDRVEVGAFFKGK